MDIDVDGDRSSQESEETNLSPSQPLAPSNSVTSETSDTTSPKFLAQLVEWLTTDSDAIHITEAVKSFSIEQKKKEAPAKLAGLLKLYAPPEICDTLLGRNSEQQPTPNFYGIRGLDFIDFVQKTLPEPKKPIKIDVPRTAIVEPTDAIMVAFSDVVVDSWRSEFFGDAFQALWRYICDNFDPELVTIYAHYIVLFQSSGTGKSRLIDELAKEIFVIPLCLRVPGTSGYPPGDEKIREYLLSRESRTTSYARSFAFMQGLFRQTAEVLNGAEFAGLSYQKTAYLFRQKMTEGMGKRKHNDFREKFYDKVHTKAETYMNDFKTKLELRKKANTEAQQGVSSKTKSKSAKKKKAAKAVKAAKAITAKQEQLTSGAQAPDTTSEQADQNHGAAGAQNQNPGQQKSGQTSGEQKEDPRKIDSDLLKGFYKAWTDLDNALKSRPGAHQAGPRVLLCFDEAHDLTHPVPPTDTDPLPWSPFGEFRATLRALISCSVFSIFLSTTGRFSQFTPLSHDDMSARVSGHSLKLIPPYCDIGFDTLLLNNQDRKLDLSGKFRLRDVVRDEFMSQFGRPLFGAMYQHGNEGVIKSMRTFVTQKLLNFHQGLPTELSAQQKTACLGFRLPFEFLSTTYIAQSKELDQVEGHLRVCLRPNTDSESLITISPSEPFVSEAAVRLMLHKTIRFNPIETLKDLMTGFSIHTGDRGEFVALLLLTLARDNSVKYGDQDPVKERVFSLYTFLDNLIQTSDAKPNTSLTRIKKDFPHASMHFNHYIRPHQQKMIGRDYLLLYMGRGAAVLCATNTPKVDIVHPFLLGRSTANLEADAISPLNCGIILIQVKNDPRYTASPRKSCFNEINPYKIGVLSQGQPAVPMIRIFMALASRTPGVHIVRHRPSKTYGAVHYDIWLAGLSSAVYKPIHVLQESTWHAALMASRTWDAIYKVPAGREKQKALRQASHPGAADGASHWSRWTKVIPDEADFQLSDPESGSDEEIDVSSATPSTGKQKAPPVSDLEADKASSSATEEASTFAEHQRKRVKRM